MEDPGRWGRKARRSGREEGVWCVPFSYEKEGNVRPDPLGPHGDEYSSDHVEVRRVAVLESPHEGTLLSTY